MRFSVGARFVEGFLLRLASSSKLPLKHPPGAFESHPYCLRMPEHKARRPFTSVPAYCKRERQLGADRGEEWPHR